MMAVTSTTSELFPEHRADLEKSGLSDETIKIAGLCSLPASALEPLLGWVPPVESGLVIPYPGEEGFVRVKVFPAYKDDSGHSVRYLQRKDSGSHIYVPPGVLQVLPNPTIPLGWCEGEKKSLKGVQEGLFCLAMGGLWNWTTAGNALPFLDTMAHVERIETIYPDSGVWARPDLLQAVFAFSKELELRGAVVRIAIIPPNADGSEQKLDDLLTREGQSALQQLKHVTLKAKVFSRTAEWWKVWRAQHNLNGQPTVASEKLLEYLSTGRGLHPAQDYVDGVLYFGMLTELGPLLVTSERKVLQAHELPSGFWLDDRGFDCCRFSGAQAKAYLSGAEVHGPTVLASLEMYFRRFAYFGNPAYALLLAVWTLGTYVYRLFDVFPYLWLRSPQKRCGKSRVEDLLAPVAFNASSRMTNPTEAVVFRGPSQNGGALLLDEVERLGGSEDGMGGLLGVLNDGYKKGGLVPRMEKQGDSFVVVNYPTYAPRVLAGLAKLATTLEDRSIPIFMDRRLPTDPIERFSPRRLTEDVQRLRDDCYIWALMCAADVSEAYEAEPAKVFGKELLPTLNGLDDRARELWEPLLTIAALVDQEARDMKQPTNTLKRLTELAVTLSSLRDDTDIRTAKLIVALREVLKQTGKEEEEWTPTTLWKLLVSRGVPRLKSTRALANAMNALGFFKLSRWGGGTGPKVYHLSRQKIEDLAKRYGVSEDPEQDAGDDGPDDDEKE